jgi:hypothetical protein
MSDSIVVISNIKTTELILTSNSLFSINKKQEKKVIDLPFSQSIVSSNFSNLAPVTANISQEITNNLKEVSSIAYKYTDDVIFDQAVTHVIEKSVNYIQPETRFKSISVNVQDYRPPNIGGGAIGGGLKNMILTAQKNAFFEILLSFQDRTVREVTGLPNGLVFELGRIKGVPIYSGQYPITIKLDNGSTVAGIINVSHLPREL